MCALQINVFSFLFLFIFIKFETVVWYYTIVYILSASVAFACSILPLLLRNFSCGCREPLQTDKIRTIRPQEKMTSVEKKKKACHIACRSVLVKERRPGRT